MISKHSLIELNKYLNIHYSVFKSFEVHFVNPNFNPKFIKSPANLYELKLENEIMHSYSGAEVLITIYKTAKIEFFNGTMLAKTDHYKYNASSKNQFIRYHSPHGSHNMFHHKHTSDNSNVQDMGQSWPHVGEFLDEVLKNF